MTESLWPKDLPDLVAKATAEGNSIRLYKLADALRREAERFIEEAAFRAERAKEAASLAVPAAPETETRQRHARLMQKIEALREQMQRVWKSNQWGQRAAIESLESFVDQIEECADELKNHALLSSREEPPHEEAEVGAQEGPDYRAATPTGTQVRESHHAQSQSSVREVGAPLVPRNSESEELESYKKVSKAASDLLQQYLHENERLKRALQSIANNSCCGSCREAANVAKKALS